MRAFVLVALAALALAGSVRAATPASVDAVLDPFRKGRFEELDATLAELARDDVRTDLGGRMVDTVLVRLAANVVADETLLPVLEKWKRASKHRPWAEIAGARVQLGLAWKARGTNFASKVDPAAWPEWTAHLELAEAALTRALVIDPKAREPRALRVWIALYKGLPLDEIARRMEQALAVDPVSPEAHDAMFEALTPRWVGSREMLFAFARESAGRSPQDPYLALLVVHAHEEARGNDPVGRIRYFHDPRIWGEVSAAMDRFLAAYPDSSYGHNLLAYLAKGAGERTVLGRELAWIGDDFDPRVWNLTEFDGARTWARQTASASPRARPPN